MEKINWFISKYRKVIMGLVVFVTIFMLYGFRYLRIESDITKWIRQDLPEIKTLNYISERYGGEDVALLGLESDSLFSVRGLKLLAELQDSLEILKGVSGVTSIISMLDIRGTQDGIEVKDLIDRYNLPEKEDSILELKRYILSRDIYRGRIISQDGRTVLYIIRLQRGVNKPEISRKIKSLTHEILKKSNLPVKPYFSGTPLLLDEINREIISDMEKLVPFVVIIVFIVLFAGMRNIYGVLLPLTVVVLAGVWTIGLMAYLHIPLSVVSNTMPVLLIAVGSAYGIHVISRYARHLSLGKEKIVAMSDTLKEVTVPVLLAAFTTMASFFSFVGSYLVVISQFGIFTGIGILISLVLSIIFIPAVLLGVNYRVSSLNRVEGKDTFYEKLSRSVAWFIKEHSFWAILVGIVIFSFGVWGFYVLRPSSNLLEYFSKDSYVRKSAEFLRKNFKGDVPVYVLVKGDLKNPYVLQEMVDFEKFMRSRKDIGFPNSYADLIMSVNEAAFGEKMIPETEEQVENLSFMLEGRPILSQLVNSDYTEGIISANATSTAYWPIKRYFDRVLVRDIVPILRDTLTDKIIQEYLAHRAAMRIFYDMKFRGFIIDTEVVERTLIGNYGQNVRLSGEDIKKIKVKIKRLFGEEGLSLKENQLDNLTVFLASESVDTTFFRAYVNNIVPNGVKKEDPEIVSYLVESLLDTRRDVFNKKKVEIVFGEVLKGLPKEVKSCKELVKDIKGDVATFLKRHTYVSASLVDQDGKIKIKAVYSGLLPVEEKINENIIKSQVKSMLIAFFVVLILVSIDTGAILSGILASLTILLVVAIDFGLMALFGLTLNSGTMLVASIAIGIGIDYTIHFLSHLKQEVQRGLSIEEGVEKTILEKGKPIMINATTVGLGFLVLVFASLVPIKNFGWLLFVTMLTSSFMSLSFLPALIIILKKPFLKAFTRKKGGLR